MYYGIEHRSPILNQKLLGLSFSCRNEYLLRNGYGKFILRDILSEFSHEDVAWSKNKIGFILILEMYLTLMINFLKKNYFEVKE